MIVARQNKDILADWKTSKFVLVDTRFHDGNEHIILLSDFNYWAENEPVLSKWCNQNNCRIEGMTVSIPDDKTLTMFMMRWS
jgi:hypothetical protein